MCVCVCVYVCVHVCVQCVCVCVCVFEAHFLGSRSILFCPFFFLPGSAIL